MAWGHLFTAAHLPFRSPCSACGITRRPQWGTCPPKGRTACCIQAPSAGAPEEAERTGPADQPQHCNKAPGPGQDRGNSKHPLQWAVPGTPLSCSACIAFPDRTSFPILLQGIITHSPSVSGEGWPRLSYWSGWYWGWAPPAAVTATDPRQPPPPAESWVWPMWPWATLWPRVTWTCSVDPHDIRVTQISATHWVGGPVGLPQLQQWHLGRCWDSEGVLFPGYFPSQQEDMVSWTEDG